MFFRRNISVWLVGLLLCNLSFGGTQALWLCLHGQALAHVIRKDVALQECHPSFAAEVSQEGAKIATGDSVVCAPEHCTDIKLGNDSVPKPVDQQLTAPAPVFVILFSLAPPQARLPDTILSVPAIGRTPPAQLHAALGVADSVVFHL